MKQMALQQNLINIHGEKGQKWLDELPETRKQLAKELNLKDLQPVENLTFNYVLKGMQDNKPIVLKIGIDHEALFLLKTITKTSKSLC